MATGSSFILAIDQGTTSSRAVLVDELGGIRAVKSFEFAQHFPHEGWVEHHAEEIWQSVNQSIKGVLELSGVSPQKILAIGITNQRETVVAWDKKTLKPLGPAIVWQCRRTTDMCTKLKRQPDVVKRVRTKTGLLIDPYFSGTKIRWILENNPDARRLQKEGRLAFGTMDAFLIGRLTGGKAFVTDVSNASRTLLMDLKTLDYDSELLKTFKVRRESLPEILPSSGEMGRTLGHQTLPDGLPITGVAGDQQAALFGQTCFKEGECKVTFGTGSFLMMTTGPKIVRSKHKLLTTVGWQIKGEKPVYALEGGAFICGAAVQWLRDELGMIASSSEVEQLAAQVPNSGGVQFVPALTGLGAPYWDPAARGSVFGLTRGSSKAHLARATLESMALQNSDILEAMAKDLRLPVKVLRVDGGASRNDLLMQMQADYTGVRLERPQNVETTVMGAAFLAGIGIGLWSPKKLAQIRKVEAEFKPLVRRAEREIRRRHWKSAVQMTSKYAQLISS